MSMRYGFEREFFVVNESNEPVILLPGCGLPMDSCGWLIEARGQPQDTVIEAAFSLLADEYKIKQKIAAFCKQHNTTIKLSAEPVMKISKSLRTKAARVHKKSLIRYQNFYGHEFHKTKGDERTAGTHFSVTKQRLFAGANGISNVANVNFDWPQLFTQLDKEFAKEIAETKRQPGFYEMKTDGRVEWRSLPNNIPPQQIADRIQKILEKVSF